MADQRNITFGMRWEIDDALDQIGALQDKIQSTKEDMITLEQESDEVGSRAARSAGIAAQGIQEIGDKAAAAGTAIQDSAGVAGAGFRKLGADADSMGEAIAKSSGQALKEWNSIPKAIRVGMQGAFGYAEKQVSGFEKKVQTGTKKMAQAFRHPVKTLKSGVIDALHQVGRKLTDVGKDAEETEKDLENMGEAGKDAGSGIKDVVEGIAGKFVLLQAGIELAKAGIEKARELASSVLEISQNAETVGAKFDAVFRDDAGISEWTENFSEGINRSKTQVQDFLVQNKALYTELGITGNQATDLSKITTSLAYDFGAALKIDDTDALSAVQEYISGNTAALAQYGVRIDDAALKQAALDMGIRKGIDEMSDAQAAQVRMNALLENSSSIQQQAVGAQSGYVNGIKSIKAKMVDLAADIGARFVPAFDKVTGTVLEAWPKIEPAVLRFFDFFGNGIARVAPGLTDLAVKALPPLISTLQEVFMAAEPIGGALITLATTALPPLVSALAPVASVIGNLAQTVLPPFARIISTIARTAIPPLVDVANVLIGTVIEPMLPILENMVNALMPGFRGMLQGITPLISALSPVLGVVGTVLGEIAGFLGKIVGFAAEGTLLSKIAGFFGGGASAKSGGGDDLPHNDVGTPNFRGGWTHINERGGEVAYLPSGSTIIPADKSRQLIGNLSGQNTQDITLNLSIPVTVQGNADERALDELERRIRKIVEEEVPRMIGREQDRQNSRMAIQEGYA